PLAGLRGENEGRGHEDSDAHNSGRDPSDTQTRPAPYHVSLAGGRFVKKGASSPSRDTTLLAALSSGVGDYTSADDDVSVVKHNRLPGGHPRLRGAERHADAAGGERVDLRRHARRPMTDSSLDPERSGRRGEPDPVDRLRDQAPCGQRGAGSDHETVPIRVESQDILRA